MIDAQQDKSSYQRHQKASRLIRIVVTDRSSEEGSEEGPRYTDQHGDEDAARLFAWHDELGERADNQTDESRPNQMQHSCPPYWFPGPPETSRLMGEEYSYFRLMQEVGPGRYRDFVSRLTCPAQTLRTIRSFFQRARTTSIWLLCAMSSPSVTSAQRALTVLWVPALRSDTARRA